MKQNGDFSEVEAISASSNREVLLSVMMSPSRVIDHATIQKKEVKDLLGKYLGKAMGEPESDPILVYALGFLADKVPEDKAEAFLKSVFKGAHHEKGKVDTAKERMDYVAEIYKEMMDAAKAIRKKCGRKDPKAVLHDLEHDEHAKKGELNAAKTALSSATGTMNGYTTSGTDDERKRAQQALDNARATHERAEKAFHDAEHKYEEFNHAVDDFTVAGQKYTKFIQDTKELPLPKPADNKDDKDFETPVNEAITFGTNLAGHLTKGASFDLDEAMKIAEDRDFEKKSKTVLRYTEALHKREEDKTKKADEHHDAHDVGSSEFLYKLYHTYNTTEEKDGGGVKDGTKMTDLAKRNVREQALLFTRFAISDAKDQSVMYANRARAENLASSKLSKKNRALFLPQLNTILAGLSHITRGETEKPFSVLRLKKDMSRMEIRHAIKTKKLKEKDMAYLAVTLEAILEGNEGKYLKKEDIPSMVAMIRNLRLIHEEQRFQKIMKSGKPYADKLKEALSEDKSFDEARATIDAEKIFEIASDPKYVKKQKEAMKAKKAAEAAAAKEGGAEDADAKAGDAFVAAQQEQTHHLISTAGGGYFSRARAILARAGGAFVSAADKTFFSIPRWGERKVKNTWKRALNTKASFKSGMLWGTFAQASDFSLYSLLPAGHHGHAGGDAHAAH